MRFGTSSIIGSAAILFVLANVAGAQPPKQEPAKPETPKQEAPKAEHADGERSKVARPELDREILNLQDCFKKDKIDTQRMTKAEVALLDTLIAGKEPTYNDVTACWLSAEVTRFNALRGKQLSASEVRDVMRTTVMNNRAGAWTELKLQVIERTKKRLSKKEFLNNDTFSSPLDVLYSGKADARAMTSLLHLAARHAWASDFYLRERPVVIFTRGHMLPGVVTTSGGKDTLLGLETAVDGKGFRDFGPIGDLGGYTEPVRVIDAEAFALLEIFGDRLPERIRSCWAEVALNQSADRYRIRGDVVERRVVEATKDLKPEQAPARGSVGFSFAFGAMPNAAADRKREKQDSVVVTATIAPPESLPAPTTPKGGIAANVRTPEEMVRLLKDNGGDSPLTKLEEAELRVKLDVWVRESIAAWRENKERENLERGLPPKAFESHNLPPNTMATLHRYVTTQAEALIPAAARTASQAVYDAQARVEAKVKDALKGTLVKSPAVLELAARQGRDAVRMEPAKRQAFLQEVIGRELEPKGVTGTAKAELLPLLVDLELKRIQADAAWLRVLLPGIPDMPPREAPKKEGPPVTAPAPNPVGPNPAGPPPPPVAPPPAKK